MSLRTIATHLSGVDAQESPKQNKYYYKTLHLFLQRSKSLWQLQTLYVITSDGVDSIPWAWKLDVQFVFRQVYILTQIIKILLIWKVRFWWIICFVSLLKLSGTLSVWELSLNISLSMYISLICILYYILTYSVRIGLLYIT